MKQLLFACILLSLLYSCSESLLQDIDPNESEFYPTGFENQSVDFEGEVLESISSSSGNIIPIDTLPCEDGCCRFILPSTGATFYRITDIGHFAGGVITVCPEDGPVFISEWIRDPKHHSYATTSVASALVSCSQMDCPQDCSDFSVDYSVQQAGGVCCKVDFTNNVPSSLQGQTLFSGINPTLAPGTQIANQTTTSITICGNIVGSTIRYTASIPSSGCLETVSHTMTSICK